MENLLTEKNNRVDVADVLRGLAVMGIIILHSIEHFNFYSFPDTTGQASWLNFTDKAIWDSLFFTFGAKPMLYLHSFSDSVFIYRTITNNAGATISGYASCGDWYSSSSLVISMPCFSQPKYWSCTPSSGLYSPWFADSLPVLS